jgi:negative regulator of flagellin synthesis FlgM
MKINGPESISKILTAYQNQVKKTPKSTATKQENPVEEGKDLLEISPLAKTLQMYRQELAGISDVRPELVKAIQQQIKEGNFIMEAKKIAAGLIEEANLLDEEI